MKVKAFRILFLALVCAAFTVGASAQGYLLSNSQRMLPFALGSSLSVCRERYDKKHQKVVETFQKQIKYWGAEIKPVTELKKSASPALRRSTVDSSIKALLGKMNPSDKWKVSAGIAFGDVYNVLLNAIETRSSVDAFAVNSDLDELEAMLNDVPADVPDYVVRELRSFSNHSENSYDRAAVSALIDQAQRVLDAISRD